MNLIYREAGPRDAAALADVGGKTFIETFGHLYSAADLAAFTAADLDEARSRLTRLAQIFDVRLRALSETQLDRRDGEAWSPRQIAFHLTESAYYAESVGDLSSARPRA